MKFEKVEHIKVTENLTVKDLVESMHKSGVMQAGKIGKASQIYLDMYNDDCSIFLGAAGALIPGGMRELLIDILENGKIKVFVCTGAMLTHDLIEALGDKHFKGHHLMSDSELNKKGYDRMYDSLMSNQVYFKLEKFFEDNISYFENKKMNIREFTNLLGSLIKERSILKICFDKKIPIFCPAISDSGIGLMIWGQLSKKKNINVDVFDDLKDIIEISWTSNKCGVFYFGGGVPKNYIQQAMQFSPKTASYGIQITTDNEHFGGSSGAPLREGISWGKMDENGKFVDVHCDVTIALPLIWGYVKSKI